VLLKNYGTAQANNTAGTLASSSPYVTVNDNAGSWGNIPAGGTVENLSNPFGVTLGSSTPLGAVIDFSMIITSALRYQDTLYFSLIAGGPGNDYITHDCGNVKLSMTRYGTLGYMSAYAPIAGDGFCYPVASASHLFYGTFAVGNAATYCIDRYFKGGTCDDDWHTSSVPDGSMRMSEPGPGSYDEYATGQFDDSGHPFFIGLACEQSSWAYNDPTANDFVTVRYLLRNGGSATITNLYAALFMDWDVGVATSDQGSSDPVRKLTWLFQNTPYVGVAILDPPRTVPAANLSMVSHLVYVYPLNGLPDSMIIKFMNGTIQQPSTDTIYDWTACNSSGPFTLTPGQTYIAAFAVLAGDNLSDLQANADTAYNRYWGAIGAEEHKAANAPSSHIRIIPAITRNKNCAVCYDFQHETPVLIKIYNSTGQVIAESDHGMCRGSSEISIDMKPFAQGIYFVAVQTDQSVTTSKIIWLK